MIPDLLLSKCKLHNIEGGLLSRIECVITKVRQDVAKDRPVKTARQSRGFKGGNFDHRPRHGQF